MIYYLVQTVAFQLLFLIVYDLFLKKETFFKANRWYLLLTPILSFILPFIKISAVQEAIPEQYYVQLPALFIGNTTSESLIDSGAIMSSAWLPTISQFWLMGILLTLFLFIYKLYKVFRLKRSGDKTLHDGLTIIQLSNTDMAFSFFNMIFIGSGLSEDNKTSIIAHEKVHVQQGHSWDLIFFELLRICCWFNPLIYIYQHRMAVLQEYTVDAKVASQKDKSVYYQDLLSQVFQTNKISFINTFFNHSLIKNRIVMLQKSKSKNIFKLKYLLLIPVVCAIVVYTSCAQENGVHETKNDATAIANYQSEIMNNIAALKQSIAASGEMTEEEEVALSSLMMSGYGGDGDLHTAHFDVKKSDFPVSFKDIDRGPTFPGCEGLTDEQIKNCFNKKLMSYVGEEFNTKVAKSDVSGRQKISVKFNIDKNGLINNVIAKAASPELQAEGLRVIMSLPKMIPAEHQGKIVAVDYALPIIFEIE